MSTAALKSDSTGFPPGKSRDFRRDLLSDESGATMVIGVFMAAMLVGFLYYMYGMGSVIIHRDRLQDAADSGAFAAAVIHARAMNILSILNMIMAVFAIVGAAFRIAQDIVFWSAFWAWIGCSWPYCVDAVRHTADYRSTRSRASNIESYMETLTRITHGVAVLVREGAPIMAQARVVTWSEHYDPTTNIGVMYPLLPSLAAEEDDSNWPCREKVKVLAMIGGGAISLFSTHQSGYYFAGLASGLAEEGLTSNRSDYWCDMDNFQKVEEGAWLGEQEFQLLAFMEGPRRYEWAEEGVAVAGWGETGSNMTDDLRAINNFSVAQAEYYFEDDGGQDHEEWLWHCQWRARMRRVDLDVLPIPGLEMLNGLVAH